MTFQYDCIVRASDSGSLIEKLEKCGMKRSMMTGLPIYVATYKGWIITSEKKLIGDYIDCGEDERKFLALSLQSIPDGPYDLYIVSRSCIGYRPGSLHQNLPLQSNIHPDFYRKATKEEIINFLKRNQEFSLNL